MIIENVTPATLDAAADTLAEALRLSGDTIVAFDGEMGAGKTTLIRRLVERLGADADEVNSPSFSIVNVYDTPDGPIYHFDLYRLDSPEDGLDIGLYDYLDSGALCLLEWPERVAPLLPEEETARVSITVADDADHTRTVSFTPSPARR